MSRNNGELNGLGCERRLEGWTPRTSSLTAPTASTRILPAITHLQRRVVAIGVLFTVATVAGVFAFDAPKAGITVPLQPARVH